MTYDIFVILAVDIFALLAIGVTIVCLLQYAMAPVNFRPVIDSTMVLMALLFLRSLLGELPPL